MALPKTQFPANYCGANWLNKVHTELIRTIQMTAEQKPRVPADGGQ